MSIRLLFPAIAWMSFMLLFFFRHYGYDQKWNWNGFTNDTIVHCILFLGSTHIWLGVLKKQLKYQFLRDNAYSFVLISSVILVFVIEFVRYYYSFSNYFNVWNFIFDTIGIILGIGTFRLLYRSCC